MCGQKRVDDARNAEQQSHSQKVNTHHMSTESARGREKHSERERDIDERKSKKTTCKRNSLGITSIKTKQR